MDTCGICKQSVEQLFETGQDGVFACFKCQPLVPEVTLEQESEQGLSNEAAAGDLTCGVCHKSFQKSGQLQNHLRHHRAERRFVCTYCSKAFSQSNNLRAHLRIHTNERPYKCTVCDKAFTQVTNLNNHVRLHTGERPFVCPEPGCGKAYAQVTNLNQHRKRHADGRGAEVGYPCPACGELFEQRNHMYTHRREAHGARAEATTHSCEQCGAALPSERRLAAHVAAHHPAPSDEPSTYKCVFSTCGAVLASRAAHTEHLLRAHQLRVLAVDAPAPRRRGRPPKTSKLDPLEMTDPLDPEGDITYDMQVDKIKQQLYVPKLKVPSLFQ